ncbi:MIP family Ig-specific serine endopeptidase [Mycoplasma tauri]|uniref:MIP family Ig-specific serine endopeptidase n=1 Tax=Mycoplasma tauri TaxID=547987 RepID=UPI001CBF6FD6|nr:DUF31 family protein [Mycoplasma tauri]MBZ4218282.1 hypothetical protein [Mycoplasma tauri]
MRKKLALFVQLTTAFPLLLSSCSQKDKKADDKKIDDSKKTEKTPKERLETCLNELYSLFEKLLPNYKEQFKEQIESLKLHTKNKLSDEQYEFLIKKIEQIKKQFENILIVSNQSNIEGEEDGQDNLSNKKTILEYTTDLLDIYNTLLEKIINDQKYLRPIVNEIENILKSFDEADFGKSQEDLAYFMIKIYEYVKSDDEYNKFILEMSQKAAQLGNPLESILNLQDSVNNLKESSKKIKMTFEKWLNEANKKLNIYQPQPDNFPGFIPPNFPKSTNSHEYPSFASKFEKVDEKILYKEIFDRTFSVKFLTKLKNGDMLSNGSGTTWLLDYYKYKQGKKYKLFFATNLHVMSNLSNTLPEELNKKLNYVDPSGNQAIGIAIGKAKSSENISEPQVNNTAHSVAHKNNWAVNYYANSNDFVKYESNHTTKFSEAISAPKLVFAAFDFMNDEAVAKYNQKLIMEAKAIKESKIKNGNFESYKDAWDHFDKNQEVPFMVDFGVFEIDVDLDKADETLKKWLSDAINGLDRYLDRLNKTKELPNQDKNISKYMLTKDYISAFHNKDSSEKNLTNTWNIYIGGYPADNNNPVWARNNPIERYSATEKSYTRGAESNEKTFSFATNDAEAKVGEDVINFSIFDTYFNRVMASWYGFHYNIKFSSLYYGASGSLAYNEFGQMIGIYDSVNSNISPGNLLGYGGIAPFIQSDDIENAGGIVFAYNLIDGSNKDKFKKQKKSFRENLREIYPTGFEDGIKTTKLFEQGF